MFLVIVSKVRGSVTSKVFSWNGGPGGIIVLFARLGIDALRDLRPSIYIQHALNIDNLKSIVSP